VRTRAGAGCEKLCERTDIDAKTDLEFLMERLSKLPTRQELAPRPLYVIFGGAAAFATVIIEVAKHL
jgi:hypothetical protein